MPYRIWVIFVVTTGLQEGVGPEVEQLADSVAVEAPNLARQARSNIRTRFFQVSCGIVIEFIASSYAPYYIAYCKSIGSLTVGMHAVELDPMARQYWTAGRNAAMEANRQAAIDAALNVIATSGAEGLTMKAVAAETGMSLRNLYNYFETREGLLTEVFSAVINNTQHEVEVRVASELSPRQRLEQFVAALFDAFDAQRRFIPLLLSITGVPEIEERVQSNRASRHRGVRQLLRSCGLRGVALEQATAVAYVLISFSSYTSLTGELGLAHNEAINTVVHVLDQLLPDRPAGEPRSLSSASLTRRS
jgi:AcrR family transcriptional regulator